MKHTHTRTLAFTGRLLLWALVAALGTMLLDLGRPVLRQALDLVHAMLLSWSPLVQLVLLTGLALPAFLACRRAAGLLAGPLAQGRTGQPDDDEGMERDFERSISLALGLTSSGTVVVFLVFGLVMDRSNSWFWPSLSLFLVSVAVLAGLEARGVSLLQRKDRRLRGDILSTDFDSQFFESLDEAEQFGLYRAAYRTYGLMKTVLLLGFIAVMVARALFGIDAFALVLVAVLWFVHVTAFRRFSRA